MPLPLVFADSFWSYDFAVRSVLALVLVSLCCGAVGVFTTQAAPLVTGWALCTSGAAATPAG